MRVKIKGSPINGGPRDKRAELVKLAVKPPIGHGTFKGWRIRKLNLFATCCKCKKLCKRGTRCYVYPWATAQFPDRYMHLECGPPESFEEDQ